VLLPITGILTTMLIYTVCNKCTFYTHVYTSIPGTKTGDLDGV
jgi:hypothetical protein